MKILLFAQARKLLSRDTLDWEIETPQSVNSLWEWLQSEHPALLPLRASSRIACNESYLQDQSGEGMLQPNDVVAIIPPVSGG